MTYKQLFFINNKLFGKAPRFISSEKGGHFEPESLIFYCQYCGEVYAKCPVIRSDGSQVPWIAYRRCCGKCSAQTTRYNLPESIWCVWDQGFLNALPLELLKKELLLTIKYLGG